jgi:hypothetical protein
VQEAKPTAPSPTMEMEKHILSILLPNVETIYDLHRALQKMDLTRLSVDDFESTQYRGFADLLLKALDQEGEDVNSYLDVHLPLELQEVKASLVQPAAKPGKKDIFHDQKVFEDLVRTVIHLRLYRIKQEIDQLRYMQEENQQEVPDGLNLYQDIIHQYYQTRNRLDKALAKPVKKD